MLTGLLLGKWGDGERGRQGDKEDKGRTQRVRGFPPLRNVSVDKGKKCPMPNAQCPSTNN
ncbi:hypothetical protein [Tolypothrix sp. VBCCA 56010]|uniref:hypothetical protein n=1 Tax=Tolypothrix sp. VBCCA 56010 TaxID=3137731 RepID=UPI003D7DF3BF